MQAFSGLEKFQQGPVCGFKQLKWQQLYFFVQNWRNLLDERWNIFINWNEMQVFHFICSDYHELDDWDSSQTGLWYTLKHLHLAKLRKQIDVRNVKIHILSSEKLELLSNLVCMCSQYSRLLSDYTIFALFTT